MTSLTQSHETCSATHTPFESYNKRLTQNSVLNTFATWQERWVQRRQLARLTRWELEDIGKSRREALAEAGRPFWEA